MGWLGGSRNLAQANSKGLMEFCADEDVCGEVGLAMLAASSLKRRAVKHAMMEEELHGIIEDEGGGMDA